MKKKSQVTIFIILGLIILVTASMFFFIDGESSEDPLRTVQEQQPSQFAGQTEIGSYVDTCLQDSVLQGLEIMRLQGGYIVIPEDIKTLKVKDLDNKQIKLIDGSLKVVIDENGPGNSVPFWIEKDKVAVPSPEHIGLQLDRYLFFEVNKCLNDFKPFKEQGFQVSYGPVETIVEVGNSVITTLNLPIEAKKEDLEISLNKFVFSAPINLEDLQDISYSIAAYQNSFGFLEDHTKNLISLHSGLDANKLPPFFRSIINTDCNSIEWSKQTSKERLKKILEENVPEIRIDKTDYNPIEYKDLMSKGVYESFIYDFLNKNQDSTQVSFNYNPEWGFMEYDILPSRGDALIPNIVEKDIPLVSKFCVLEYENKYTLNYPVLARVNNKESSGINIKSSSLIKNAGFEMQYFMDSYICGNQEKTCRTRPNVEVDLQSISEEFDVEIIPETQFCDPEQRTSEDISLEFSDASDGSGIEGLNLYYFCGNYQNNCFIGRTNNQGTIIAKFPQCVNGILHASKKNYSGLMEQLSIYGDYAKSFSYQLMPLKDVEVFVEKIDATSLVRNYFETGKVEIEKSSLPLEADETVFISGSGPTRINYYHPKILLSRFELVPGDYSFGVSLSKNTNLKSKVIEGKEFGGIQGNFPMGILNFDWDVKEVKDKMLVYALSNYDLGDGGISFGDISDPLLDSEGSLSAELAYRCEKIVLDNEESCNLDNCEFINASGILKDDFESDYETCEIEFNVTIAKEDYINLIKPRFI